MFVIVCWKGKVRGTKKCSRQLKFLFDFRRHIVCKLLVKQLNLKCRDSWLMSVFCIIIASYSLSSCMQFKKAQRTELRLFSLEKTKFPSFLSEYCSVFLAPHVAILIDGPVSTLILQSLHSVIVVILNRVNHSNAVKITFS